MNTPGTIQKVIAIAAQDLVVRLREVRTMREAFEVGHQRNIPIDDILLNHMGLDVRKYWLSLHTNHRALLRRKVWEAALIGLDTRRPSK